MEFRRVVKEKIMFCFVWKGILSLGWLLWKEIYKFDDKGNYKNKRLTLQVYCYEFKAALLFNFRIEIRVEI